MRLLSILTLCLSLLACGKPAPTTLTIGTITGPETDLVETAKEVALNQYGLTIKIIEFNDYNLPNEALQDGSLDANVYQHLPYFKASMKAHNYHFEIIGKSFVYPMAIYSHKYKALRKLPNHALIAIPNDPSNETRALLLLKKAGLITLKKTTNGTTDDILTNPKQFQFKELDAAVINSSFAIPADLRPSRDGLFVEQKDSPYANLIVIRQDSDKKRQLEEFVKAMNSVEVKKQAKNLFGDAAIPAW